jgi:hypothetical protein
MVDVIYIDPPYNTGARDWKYNNDYVDVVDEYRHSKWLAMMKKRLKLARRLRSTLYQRGYSRSSNHKSLGICANHYARENDGRIGRKTPTETLD